MKTASPPAPPPAAPAAHWIGTAEVAAELNIKPKKAYELIRRLGVPLLAMAGGRMDEVRFLRADWEAARDAALKPIDPRAGKVAEPTPAPKAGRSPTRPAGPSFAEQMAALRDA